jgi:Tfp pilus assembly protein FimV
MIRTNVRCARLGSVALALVAFVSFVGGRAGAGPAGPEPRRTYVVLPGDTLWGIARRTVGPTEDPRPLVDRLIRTNRLQDAALVPGERLVIPSGER